MANTQFPSHFYVDTAGELFATGPIKITRIIYLATASNDELVIRESASGPNAVRLKGSSAHDLIEVDLSETNVVLHNGVYVQTISAGSSAQIFYRRG